MAGYRFNLKNWFAVEGDYDYFRNHEKFLSSSGSHIHTDECSRRNWCCHCEASFIQDACRQGRVSIRARWRRSHVLRSTEGAVNKEQTRGAFVYGGGFDVPLAKHIACAHNIADSSIRLPDFEMTSLKVDKYTHSAVPSVGLVFTF